MKLESLIQNTKPFKPFKPFKRINELTNQLITHNKVEMQLC